MVAHKNSSNLYEFNIEVTGSKKTRVYKGLIDTGSTHCACTYKIITTLWARPITFKKISAIQSKTIKCLIYNVGIGFDGKETETQLIRVANMPEGIDFVLGMSVLSKCNVSIQSEDLFLTWK